MMCSKGLENNKQITFLKHEESVGGFSEEESKKPRIRFPFKKKMIASY
jgi:hypothetical protein